MHREVQRGFTLIEMMVTIVILGVLVSIAVPSYQQYIIRGKRSAAQSAMLDIANREQQFFLANRAYADQEHWSRMSILNAARSGKFSSDRTVHEYCKGIWHVNPVPIRLLSPNEVKAGFLQ